MCIDARFVESSVAKTTAYAVGEAAVVATALPVAANQELLPSLHAHNVLAERVGIINLDNFAFVHLGIHAHRVVIEVVEIE